MYMSFGSIHYFFYYKPMTEKERINLNERIRLNYPNWEIKTIPKKINISPFYKEILWEKETKETEDWIEEMDKKIALANTY